MATVQVPGVWPPGSNVSITGAVTAGDGHVVGASPGVQFGTVTISLASLRAVGGVASAQAFGVPLALLTGGQSRVVNGVPSAAAFGTLKLRVTVPSAGGVVSAQAFGAVGIYARITVPVSGVQPYPFYIPSVTGSVISGDGHVVGGYGGTAFQFGHPAIYTIVRVTIGGVGSAQQFGAVKIIQIVHPPGVLSAQAFGTRIGIKFRILGLDSEQQFGKPWVFLVWIRVEVCTDLELAEAVCTDLDLDEAPVTEVDLQPLVCT